MTERLVTIDGSQGEGGGQVLRSSLHLPGDGPAFRDRENPPDERSLAYCNNT